MQGMEDLEMASNFGSKNSLKEPPGKSLQILYCL
jgi:hypothetical protein